VDTTFKELLGDFLLEARERLDRVEELLLGLKEQASEPRREAIEKIKRDLHTLKGNSGMMGLGELQAVAHEVEDLIQALDPKNPEVEPSLAGLDRFRSLLRSLDQGGQEDSSLLQEASQDLALGSVRVPFSALDELGEQLAEVLLYRNRLSGALEHLEMEQSGALQEGAGSVWQEVSETHESLNKTLDVLQERIIHLRMVPLQTLFRHLGRIVHDESLREGKEVRLETAGGSTPLDKALLEVAGEVLGHLVRNAVNHGIETPQVRRRSKKNPVGTVRISAAVHGQEVRIEVADDGAGIDLTALRRAAVHQGRAAQSPQELYDLLFEPGFSTREGADLSAGRGIGLSAVLEAIERYGGRIEVNDNEGAGSRFSLRLPFSISITRTLIVGLGSEIYALPLGTILESVRYHERQREVFGGREVLRWRDEVLPVLDLGTWAGLESGQRRFAIIVEGLDELGALLVDELLGIRDVVVKGLDEVLGAPQGISGSTIQADGRVVMILDPRRLEAAKAVSLPQSLEGDGVEGS